MSTFIIETRKLSHHFGNMRVLKEIDLQVPEGSIYGFLGPNGVGKTTTIRLLLGLLRHRPDNIFLFGESAKQNRISILSRTGSLIEEPSLYAHLTGRENLVATALLRKVSKVRIEEVLEIVGLQQDANRKIKTYSLGMKQRLGLGVALLSNPALLILDEPANGLDPEGISEIRNLLMRLNKEQGITVFLSSHLLSEVEKLATHVGILNRGHLVFQGRLAELKHLQKQQSVIQIETDNVDKAMVVLKEVYDPLRFEGNLLQIPYQSHEQVSQIVRLLVQHNLEIYQVKLNEWNLEKLFLQLTVK